jgi:hypothetical protein
MSSNPTSQGKKPIPAWVGPAVIAVAIGLVGLFIWWYLFGSLPSEREVAVDPSQVVQETMRGMRQQARGPAIGISRNGSDQWNLLSKEGGMVVRKVKDEYKFRPYLFPVTLVGWPDAQWITAHVRLRNDDAMAKQLGLAKEQVAQLRKMDQIAMKWTDADLAGVKSTWADYVKLKGDEQRKAQAKVMAAFDELEKKCLPASKEAAAKQLAELKQIITPEMIETLNGRKSGAAKTAK